MTEEEDSRENASAEVKEIKEKIKAAEGRQKETKQQVDRMTAQIELFDRYSTGLFSAGGQTTTNDLLDHKTIGKLVCLLLVHVHDSICITNLNFLVVKIVQNFLYAFLYNSYTFPEVLKDW